MTKNRRPSRWANSTCACWLPQGVTRCTPLVSRSSGRRPWPQACRGQVEPRPGGVDRQARMRLDLAAAERVAHDGAVDAALRRRARSASAGAWVRIRPPCAAASSAFSIDQSLDQRDLAVVELPGALQLVGFEPGLERAAPGGGSATGAWAGSCRTTARRTAACPPAAWRDTARRGRTSASGTAAAAPGAAPGAAGPRARACRCAPGRSRTFRDSASPPWISRVGRDEVPEARSCCSTSATLQAAQGQVARDARADDAAADDQHVERSALERLEGPARRCAGHYATETRAAAGRRCVKTAHAVDDDRRVAREVLGDDLAAGATRRAAALAGVEAARRPGPRTVVGARGDAPQRWPSARRRRVSP